jgi:hypothetical protein
MTVTALREGLLLAWHLMLLLPPGMAQAGLLLLLPGAWGIPVTCW